MTAQQRLSGGARHLAVAERETGPGSPDGKEPGPKSLALKLPSRTLGPLTESGWSCAGPTACHGRLLAAKAPAERATISASVEVTFAYVGRSFPGNIVSFKRLSRASTHEPQRLKAANGEAGAFRELPRHAEDEQLLRASSRDSHSHSGAPGHLVGDGSGRPGRVTARRGRRRAGRGPTSVRRGAEAARLPRTRA